MAENLDLGHTRSALPATGEQSTDGLIHQVGFTLRPRQVQLAPPNDPGGLDPLPPAAPGSRPEENGATSRRADPDLEELRSDIDRQRQWDQQRLQEERQRDADRRAKTEREPSAMELLAAAQQLFDGGKDRAAAMEKFREAIRKADAEGTGIVQYATERLQMMPPYGERDPATEKRLTDLVEKSVDKRVDARYAFADALDATGDHAGAQALRKEGVDIFLSMITAQTRAEQTRRNWDLYEAQKPQPRQFDI